MLIICCGMPRSGSTLQFNVTWKALEATGVGQRVEWQSSSDWSNATQQIREYAESDTSYVVKMHFPPDNIKEFAETFRSIRFIYVHRDIRDVIYSMKKKFRFSLPRAVLRISQSLELERWLLGRPNREVLIQEYRLLLDDLPTAIRQIAEFCDSPLNEYFIMQISDELSIEKAYNKSRKSPVRFEHWRRRLNRLLRREIAFADQQLMLHPNHVSEHRGQIGVGKLHLSSDELATIEHTFAERVDGLKRD